MEVSDVEIKVWIVNEIVSGTCLHVDVDLQVISYAIHNLDVCIENSWV